MNGWALLTSLGDTNVMLAAALVLAAWLIASDQKKLALWWVVLFGGMLTCVAATKLIFLGWGIGIANIDFTGISGHSSRAAAVIPALLFVLLGDTRLVWRRGVVVLSYLLAAAVATSRVMIEAHSVSEAVIGYGFGALVSTLFIWQARGQVQSPPRPRFVWAGVSVVFAALLLGPAPTKTWMREAAAYLSGKSVSYQRGDL